MQERLPSHWMAGENGSNGRRRYLLFVWSPNGYLLREAEGEPPPVGHEFEDEGRALVVTKVGPSPLPGDRRPCAYSAGRD
jgi:hypothetical protein